MTRNTKKKSGDELVPIPPDIFLVDKILDHVPKNAKTEAAVKKYLTSWQGYPDSENTWESAKEKRTEVATVIKKYWNKVEKSRQEKSNRKFKPVPTSVKKEFKFGVQEKRKRETELVKIPRDMFGDPFEPVVKRNVPIGTIRYQTSNGTWYLGKLIDMKVKGHCKLKNRPNLGADIAFKIKDSVTKTYFLLPICETKASHQMQYLLKQQIQRYVDKYSARVKEATKNKKEEEIKVKNSIKIVIKKNHIVTPESEKTKTPGTDLTKTEGLEEKKNVNEAKTTEKSVETAKLEQGKLVVQWYKGKVVVANIKPAEVKIIETKDENAVHAEAQPKLVEEKTDDSGIANDDNDLINLNSK